MLLSVLIIKFHMWTIILVWCVNIINFFGFTLMFIGFWIVWPIPPPPPQVKQLPDLPGLGGSQVSDNPTRGYISIGLTASRNISIGLTAGRNISTGLTAGRNIYIGLTAGRNIGLTAGRNISISLTAGLGICSSVSEQIACFLQKKEWMRKSLIHSFLVRNLSYLLTSLINKKGNEKIARVFLSIQKIWF